MFTKKEIAYINSQHLARLATVSKSLQPDVAPVGFRFDGKSFFITGFDITRTFKYKNVMAGNDLVSLVIDDLASVQPWVARGIKIHGTAEIAEESGRASLTIHPVRLWSWGLKTRHSRTEDLPAARQGRNVSNSFRALLADAKHCDYVIEGAVGVDCTRAPAQSTAQVITAIDRLASLPCKNSALCSDEELTLTQIFQSANRSPPTAQLRRRKRLPPANPSSRTQAH